MAPPPAPKRIKRPTVVLEEDTYTSAVSHIIRRDFFPGLAESDAQQEYLNALESKDKGWIREAGKKLTSVMTPVGGRATAGRGTRFRAAGTGSGIDKTPSVWAADTPRSAAAADDSEEEDGGLGTLDGVDLDMSLGAFQAKYTSEDQESFNKILDRQNKARFEKTTWLHSGNRFASKQRLAQQKVLEARKSDPNALPATNALILRPSQNLDDRPAGPDTHKHTAYNTLMFAPDSVESWAPTRAQAAESASLAPPKQVLHANTRLPVAAELPPQRPPSPTSSAIRDAIAGRPRLNESEGGFTGSETPRVKGYAFVDALPPDPNDENDDDAPTDLLERYGAKSSAATPFTISESQRREKLHHKMVERIASARKPENPQSSSNSGGSGAAALSKGLGIFASETPRFLSAPTPKAKALGMTPGRKGVGGLTPAAQRLFESMGGATPRRDVKGGFGARGTGREWTPTPKVKRRMG